MTGTEADQEKPAAAKAEPGKLGNLASRFIVALVAVPILLAAIYQPYHAITWVLVFAVGMIGVHEFLAMMIPEGEDRLGPLIIATAVVAGFYWLPLQYPSKRIPFLLLTMVAVFLLPALYHLFRFGNIKTVAARMTATTVAIIYVGMFATFIAMLKRDFPSGGTFETNVGAHLIILVLASAWLSDTGGYFAGKALGRHKLYPAVSPNKTWEGSIGGVVAAAGGAAIIKTWLLVDASWFDIMALAIPASIIGQVGDLAESLLKRAVGVKDSGALLPGHGGILDRIDAVLFIAPYVYLYMVFR